MSVKNIYLRKHHSGQTWYEFYDQDTNFLFFWQMWYKSEDELLYNKFLKSMSENESSIYNRVIEKLRKADYDTDTWVNFWLKDLVAVEEKEMPILGEVLQRGNDMMYLSRNKDFRKKDKFFSEKWK
jgi:hypothetical protein